MIDTVSELVKHSITFRATVTEVLHSGEIQVRRVGQFNSSVLCDFLQTADRPLIELVASDVVLVLAPESVDEKGVILGRIGPYKRPHNDHLQIDAKESLTLKCGDAMLKLRADGKVLSKGVEIASVAKGTNRIKGGSVQVN
jgi:hypothetical protein